MSAAGSYANPVVEIVRIARQAEQDYARDYPEVLSMVFGSAAHAISFCYQTNRSVLPAYWEMATRQREYLDALPFIERISALNSSVIPLGTEVKLSARKDGAVTRGSELELLLTTWIELEAKNAQVDWIYEDAGGFRQPQSSPEDSVAAVLRQEANARWKAIVERNNYRLTLRSDGGSFTNRVIAQIAQEYGRTPQLVAQLQEVMDGYLPPVVSTNIMNKVFQSMRSPVRAKTPRPVPGAKGERWIRVASEVPKGEPALPAIARPSRIRDGMNVRGSQGAGTTAAPEPVGSGTESSGARSVWPWALLGLAAVGGWVWARAR